MAGESADPAQPVADVEIDTEPLAAAPVEHRVAALTAPLVAAAADLVGVASAALHRSVEHAKTRRQFGTPIGAFQGIKHALADNYVSLERARSLTYAAAAPTRRSGQRTRAMPGPPRRWPRRRPATPRLNCARTAVQVHGALGQTWEHDIHLYVRHAWQGAAMLGDSRALYHEVGRRFAGRRGDDARWSRNSAHGWRNFCPTTTTQKYRQYRWDLGLRRDYQRAAFEAGWLQPTWPREHGGRSLGLRDAMEVRIEAALRSAPKLPNIQRSQRRRARHPPVRHTRPDRPPAGPAAAR